MKRLLVPFLCLALAGCVHTQTAPAPKAPQDNTARLIARPDFKAAAKAAPEWVRDALHTITSLETQVANP